MRGRDIHAEAAEIKKAVGNIRSWLDEIEPRVDRLLVTFAPPPAQPSDFTVQPTDGRDEWQPPSQVAYDDRQFDAPPRPVQPDLMPGPEVFCNCGDRAKRIEKEGKNGKPYVAYACPNPKAEGCDFWVFENQLQKV